MGKNQGVFRTSSHDTKWLRRAYDFLCDKYIIKENPRTWRRTVGVGGTFECNKHFPLVFICSYTAVYSIYQKKKMWSSCARFFFSLLLCNAKQRTVLWMGRQVLYEWRGSCDRSTSRSRYFSLTVNKRSRGISPIKTTTKCDWKWARRVQKHGMRRLELVSVGCWDQGVNVMPFLTVFFFFFFYEWGLWYVNESDWGKKKNGIFRLSVQRRARREKRLVSDTNMNRTNIIDGYMPMSWRTAVTHDLDKSTQRRPIVMYRSGMGIKSDFKNRLLSSSLSFLSYNRNSSV